LQEKNKTILTIFRYAYPPPFHPSLAHYLRVAFCVEVLAAVGHILGSMFNTTIPWWEFIVRGLLIYGFLLLVLRLTGKRQIGQLAPFDLVLLLMLSNTVQNAMIGGDTSIVGGLISATTLLVVNGLVGRITYKSKRLERLIEGRPEILIHDGKLFADVMEREQLTHHELNAALRAAGCASISEVHYAILENTGQVSVHPKKPPQGQGQASQ
jgi:uncharacterized membrane protein YcaP (DUF421 family)